MPSGAKVEIEGINGLVRALREAPEALRAEFKDTNLEAANLVLGAAEITVPSKSGALKRTLRASSTLRSGRVKAGSKRVPYANPIHWGWGRRNIHPDPFLHEALDRRRASVLDTYDGEVDKMLGLIADEVNRG